MVDSVKSDKEERFSRFFGGLLDALRSLGGSGTPDEVAERIAQDLKLPDKILNETLSSGQSRFRNQLAWARFYLVREGLVDSSKRGVWSLTEQGRKAHLSLEESHKIVAKVSKLFHEQRRSKNPTQKPLAEEIANSDIETPRHRDILLGILLGLPPSGFERLSQRLLREAGFIQVTVTGSSGDGGIDGYGTLQINPLVSFKVLFQCKRYSGSVTPSDVRNFRGAMAGRADKGIIITTGAFTAEARREATRDGVAPIEILDGQKLVDMLENLELGVKQVRAYEVDQNFFDEFRSSNT